MITDPVHSSQPVCDEPRLAVSGGPRPSGCLRWDAGSCSWYLDDHPERGKKVVLDCRRVCERLGADAAAAVREASQLVAEAIAEVMAGRYRPEAGPSHTPSS